MGKLSRRDFLFVSSGAAAGSFVAPSLVLADAEAPAQPPPSGLETGRKIPLPHQAIEGFLSEAQITPHYEAHYGGALRGYLDADERLTKGEVSGAAKGALHRARTAKGNSVLLHELYFEGMAVKAGDPPPPVARALNQRFGTIEKWAADFVDAANAASGWAILAHHPVNGKLYNVVSDEHDVGVLWMATPLLALDVYEHAYYVDYTNDSSRYIDRFMDHINWDVVGRRWP